MILHGLQKRLDGLAAEVVLAAAREGIRLVDEQHAAERRGDDLLRLDRRLADVAGHEAGAVHLHELARRERPDGVVQPAEQTGDRRLAGAGVAHEDHVHAHRRDGQAVLLAELAHLDEVHHRLDVLLHGVEADETVQLRHERIEVGLLRRLRLRGGLLLAARDGDVFRAAGGRRLRRVFIHERAFLARHIIHDVEAALALPHTGPVAQRRELVGALGDVDRLAHRHVVVDRREVQQDVRDHADELPRDRRAAAHVLLRQRPEKQRRQKLPAVAHGGRQRPQQPVRLLLAPGIDLVERRRVLLAEYGAPGVELNGAVRAELVDLGGKLAAGEPVERLGVRDVFLMQLLGGAFPLCRHILHPNVSFCPVSRAARPDAAAVNRKVFVSQTGIIVQIYPANNPKSGFRVKIFRARPEDARSPPGQNAGSYAAAASSAMAIRPSQVVSYRFMSFHRNTPWAS